MDFDTLVAYIIAAFLIAAPWMHILDFLSKVVGI